VDDLDTVLAKYDTQKNTGLWEAVSPRMLKVPLRDDYIWMHHGAMAAYTGTFKFEREGIFEQGLVSRLKRTAIPDHMVLVKASGTGELYLSHWAQNITIFNLQHHQKICVHGVHVIAFEPSVEFDIDLISKNVGSMGPGGLFVYRLKGPGKVALGTYYDPLVLKCKGEPIYTDPMCVVAWSDELDCKIHIDVNLKTFIGRGSGDSIQLKFKGDSGFVLVEPGPPIFLPSKS